MSAVHAGVDVKELTLSQLSALIGPGATHLDLEQTCVQMQQRGYVVTPPVRVFPARKRWHAEWHVRIQGPNGEATVAFFVPLDAA